MRIKRLFLSGFKSFIEPTELLIERGLTGVVGPNGCGKSNLLEAMRWVMGENSAKSMRGAGMEDVIFAGTGKRPQRQFAEVSLLLEQAGGPHASINAVSGKRPAVNDDELQVTRRIERGAGSAYRINGKDVRAKDVSLLFADAATGAHSPALVSQGRIAAVIAAKPQQRRMMLEEAAGIAGLHVRRREAEQKLRATSANLERLGTLMGDMEGRVGQLKRQARAAEKYTRLSDEIRQAEARLIFARWRDAAAAADEARRLAAAQDARVEDAREKVAEAEKAQQAAIVRAGETRAQLQERHARLSDAMASASALDARIESVQAEIATVERQVLQLAEDNTREDRLTRDAAETLRSLEQQISQLEGESKEAETRLPSLTVAAEKAEAAARDCELELARASGERARIEAEARIAKAARDAAISRANRMRAEQDRLRAAIASAGPEQPLRDELARRQAERDRASATIAETRDALETLSKAYPRLSEAISEAESELSAARAEKSALDQEKRALERDLANMKGSDGLLSTIRAEKGYETALAAALGDELSAVLGAPEDTDMPGRFWTENAGTGAAAGSNLAGHVKAPKELHASLAATLVAEEDIGQALSPGQKLVTLSGRVRRWDGYVAQGEGLAAAQKLARRNRLEELDAALPAADGAISDGEAALENARDAMAGHRAERQEQENRMAQAQSAERHALRACDQAEDALKRHADRLAETRASLERVEADLRPALAELDDAEKAVAALPDTEASEAHVDELTGRLNAAQLALRTTQAKLSSHQQEAAQLRERAAASRAEMKAWKSRAGEAAQRLAEMARRAEALEEERAILQARPEPMKRDRAELAVSIEQLQAGLSELAGAAEAAERAMRESEQAQRAAAEALAEMRESRAGAVARAENEEQRRMETARLCGERFECPPPLLPGRMNFEAVDIVDAAQESARHDRLTGERERIGPVNLVAAQELSEVEETLAQNRREFDELDEAVNRLRGSIGSLNREGRERLRAAFESVDGHFRELFTRLFNGGQAHLALVDSDDPLEAGLEIMAQPPGKRLSSLTLLSGGEQALTAVALIFALFLTNPAPICVLDEVDAPLDDANIERFCDLLDRMTELTDTRFLIVTHNAVTMSRMDRLFGVTMIEHGVSKLVSVDLGQAEELVAAE